MRRSARALLTGAFAAIALLTTVSSPAHACSMIPPVSMEGLEAALTGDPIPDQDQWILDGAVVIGLVEYTVVHAWEETLDYEAASARAATRTWGRVDGRLLEGAINGGEPRGPLVGFNMCGPSTADPFGRTSHRVVLDDGGSHPVGGQLSPAVDALLTSSLGEPAQFDAPDFDDRHPSYDRETYGWQGWFTWGRITWMVTAVLFIPVAAFGSWLYSTRRT